LRTGAAGRKIFGMKVRVRNIEASCTCGAREFRPPPHLPPYRAGEQLRCTGCGRTTSYGELLDRIGEEAISRANHALESLKHEVRMRGRR
jgi:hypothetical protein